MGLQVPTLSSKGSRIMNLDHLSFVISCESRRTNALPNGSLPNGNTNHVMEKSNPTLKIIE